MSQSTNVSQLLKTAHAEGALSKAATQALAIPDIGAEIEAALGINVDDVVASEVTLVTMLIDDSGSIRFAAGNTEAVREGHNTVLDALSESKQENSILVHTRYLNGRILYPYGFLKDAERMDAHNYNPNGGTPLYDQSVVVLGTVVAEYQRFVDNGVVARSVTLIVTDGHDEHSMNATAKTVRSIVKDLLGEKHIVAAMGIDDGNTDFQKIFGEMGIPDEWILTPGNTKSEIRKAFGTFSKSAVRASQSAKSFSTTAAGGFASP
ncbi:MAG: hypothetical protein AAB930_03185 [Patescibacteria group bacterium]